MDSVGQVTYCLLPWGQGEWIQKDKLPNNCYHGDRGNGLSRTSYLLIVTMGTGGMDTEGQVT